MELTNWCVDNNKNKHSLIKKLKVWSLSITFINILIYKIYALKVVMPCIFYESNDKWVWLRLNLNTCLKFPRSCIKALDGCFAYEKWVIGFGVKFKYNICLMCNTLYSSIKLKHVIVLNLIIHGK